MRKGKHILVALALIQVLVLVAADCGFNQGPAVDCGTIGNICGSLNGCNCIPDPTNGVEMKLLEDGNNKWRVTHGGFMRLEIRTRTKQNGGDYLKDYLTQTPYWKAYAGVDCTAGTAAPAAGTVAGTIEMTKSGGYMKYIMPGDVQGVPHVFNNIACRVRVHTKAHTAAAEGTPQETGCFFDVTAHYPVYSGAADASKSEVTNHPSNGDTKTAGYTFTVDITMKDGVSQPTDFEGVPDYCPSNTPNCGDEISVSGVNPNLKMEVTGTNAPTPSCSESSGEGNYKCTSGIFTRPGSYQWTVKYKGTNILTGTPFSLTINAGTPDATKSTVSGGSWGTSSTLSLQTTANDHTATVTLKDSQGNVLTVATYWSNVDISANNVMNARKSTTAGTILWGSTTVYGGLTLKVKYGSDTIDQRQITITAQTPDWSKGKITDIVDREVDDDETVYILPYDAWSNRIYIQVANPQCQFTYTACSGCITTGMNNPVYHQWSSSQKAFRYDLDHRQVGKYRMTVRCGNPAQSILNPNGGNMPFDTDYYPESWSSSKSDWFSSTTDPRPGHQYTASNTNYYSKALYKDVFNNVIPAGVISGKIRWPKNLQIDFSSNSNPGDVTNTNRQDSVGPFKLTKAGTYTAKLRGDSTTFTSVRTFTVVGAAMDREHTLASAGTGTNGAIRYYAGTTAAVATYGFRDSWDNVVGAENKVMKARFEASGEPNVETTQSAGTGNGATMTLTMPTKAKTWKLKLFYDNYQLSGYEDDFQVWPGAVSVSNCHIRTQETDQNGGTVSDFRYIVFVARDQFGNRRYSQQTKQDFEVHRVSGPTFTASLNPGTSTGGNDAWTTGWRYYKYTATLAGPYVIQGRIGGQTIGSPNQVSFTLVHDNFDKTKSLLTGVSPAGTALAGTAVDIRVTMKDKYENIVKVKPQLLRAQGTGPETVTANAVDVDLSQGQVRFPLTLTKKGTYTVTVQSTFGPMSPFTYTITPAAVDALKSSVSNSAQTALQEAGVQTTWVIQTRDTHSNTLETHINTTQFSIANLTSGGVASVVTRGVPTSGQFTLRFTGTIAKPYAFDVKIGGVTIPNQVTVTVKPTKIHTNSVATGAGLTGGPAGTQQFEVDAVDQYNNIQTHSTSDRALIALTATRQADNQQQTTTVVNAPTPGRYTVSYIATKAGTYQLSLLIDGALETNPVATITSASTYAQECIATGTALSGGVAGNGGTDTAFVFDMQARDFYQNNRETSTEAGDFSVQLIRSGETTIFGAMTEVGATGAGTYKGSFSVTKAGDWQVHIRFKGTHVKNSPFTTTITPHVSVASKCSVHNDGGNDRTLATAGVQDTFLIRTRDKYNNQQTAHPDSNLQISLQHVATAEVTQATRSNTGNGGEYRATFTITRSLTYNVIVKLGTSDVAGTPFTMEAATSALNPPRSSASGPGLGGTQVAGVVASFTIQGRDEFGNLRTQTDGNTFHVQAINQLHTSIPVAFSVVGKAPPTAGQYTATYTPTLTGTYTVHVREESVTGTPIQSSPFSRTVTPAATDPLKSVIAGSGLTTQIAGSDSTFTLEARDQYTNTRSVTTDALQLTASKTVGVQTTVTGTWTALTPATNGKYELKYNATIAGDYAVSVRVNNVDIQQTKIVTVHPAVLFPSLSHVDGTALTSAVAGVQSTFTITGRDAFNNQLTSSEYAWTSTLQHQTHGGVSVTGSTSGSTQGRYNSQYTATVSGTYTLTVAHSPSGVKPLGTPTNVVVQPAATNPATSFVHPSTLVAGEAGKQSTFHVQARDQFQNVRWTEDDTVFTEFKHKVFAGVSKPTTTAANRPLGTGSYSVYVTPTVSGVYALTVKLNGAHVSGSPFDVLVNPTVTSGVHSTSFGQGLVEVVAGSDQGVVYVQARDQFLNNRTVTTDDVRVQVVHTVHGTLHGRNASVSVHDAAKGLYVARFNATVSGNYHVYVRTQNLDSLDSPKTTTLVPNQPWPQNCVLQGVATYSWARGKPATFTLTVRDAFYNGRTLTDDSARISHTVTNPSIASSLQSRTTNVYTIGYTPTALGNHTLSVFVDAQLVYQSPSTVEVLEAKLSHIVPNMGVVAGATRVTIHGSDFVDSPFLAGRIAGKACTSMEFQTRERVVCISASNTAQNTTLEVSNNGLEWSTASAAYWYYPQETLTSFDPVVGPLYGRTPVTVIGTGFLHTEYLSCRFGPVFTTVPVKHISDTKIICDSPEHEVGEFKLYVSNNRQQVYTNEALNWRYLQPFSPMCRVTDEVQVAVQDRLKAGAEYHNNLALATLGAQITTTALTGEAQLPTGLVDGDRCCSENRTNQAYVCGTNFLQLSNSELASVELRLGKEAFVNEFMVVWYRPCQNQPNYYEIDMFNELSQTWTNIIKRRTKTDGPQAISQRPCYVIPSDIDKVSLCVDYVVPDLRGQRFRVRFNNSEANMGVVGTSTDGGWLYELEAHGVFTHTPEHLSLGNVINTASLPSVVQTALPTVVMHTLNHHLETLQSNDTQTQNLQFTLRRNVDGQVQGSDLRAGFVLGTYPVPFVNGVATMNSHQLLRPRVGNYTFTFFTDNGLVGVNHTVVVVIGPAYALRIQNVHPKQLVSELVTSLPRVDLYAVDAGENLVGDTDGSQTVSASSSVNLGGSTETMVNGNVSFASMHLSRPARGDYVVTFNRMGLLSVNTTFSVAAGAAFTITVDVPPTATGVYSDTYTALNTLTLKLRDAGGGLILASSGKSVSVASTNGSLVLAGPSTFACSVETCTAAGIVLLAPAPGDHSLVFTGPGLENATTTVRVLIGAPRTLAVGNTPATVYESLEQTTLNAINVRAYDASLAFVGATDTATRWVNVSLSANSTATHGRLVQGTLRKAMTKGNVTFDNLYLVRPTIGYYTLEITMSDSANGNGLVNATSFTFLVTPGPADQVQVISTQRIDVESAVNLNLPVVAARLLDAGAEFVGSLDTAIRPINASMTPSTGNLQVAGSGTVTVNGSATFDSLLLVRPLFGLYNLTISSPGLTPYTVTVNVSTGEALDLRVATPVLAQRAVADQTVLADIEVQAVDAAGSLVRVSKVLGRTVSLAEVNNTAGAKLSAYPTLPMQSARTVFVNLTMVRPTAGVYTLVFASAGLSNSTAQVTVVKGAPYRIAITSNLTEVYASRIDTQLRAVHASLFDIGSNFLSDNNAVTAQVHLKSNDDGGVRSFVNASYTATQVASSGTWNFDKLRLTRPSNGTYTLTVLSDNLLNDTAQVVVTTGPAVKLHRFEPLQVHRRSQVELSLPRIDVVARDADLNLIEAPFFVADRTASVSINASLSGQFVGTHTVSMSTAFAAFTNLTLLSPRAGVYALLFESSDMLEPVYLQVNVSVGEPVYLWVRTPASKTVTRMTEDRFAIGRIDVEAQDAGRSFVGTLDPQTRPVQVNCSTQEVLGNTTRNMVTSLVSFDDLYMVRPPVTNYTLIVSSTGLVSDALEVRVQIGQPFELRTAQPYTGIPHESVASVHLNTVVIETFDISGGFSPLTTPGTRVQAVLQNGGTSTSMNGTSECVLVAGRCTLDDLQLLAPLVGEYNITFVSQGLLPVSIVANVTIGPGTSLTMVESVLHVRSQVETPVGTAQVQLRDAGTNLVGSNDGIIRFVQLTSLNSTGDLTVTGQLQYAMVNGFSSAASVVLVRPKVGMYAFAVSADDLAGTIFQVNVSVGDPTQLVVTSASVYEVPVLKQQILTRVSLRALDAGGTWVGGNDHALRNVSLVVPEEASSMLSGSLQETMVFGSVNFDSVIVFAAPIGVYTVSFTTPSLLDTTVNLNVTIGRPQSLQFVYNGQGSYRTDKLVYINETQLRALDFGLNFVGTSDRELRLVQARVLPVNGSAAAMSLSGAAETMAAGVVTFSKLQFSSSPLGDYVIEFGSAGMSNVTMDIKVITGPAYTSLADDYPVESHPSDIRVELGSVTLQAIGASNEPTDQLTDVNVTVSLERNVATAVSVPVPRMVGSLLAGVIEGGAVYTGGAIERPAAGKFDLVFTYPAWTGVAGTRVTITVVTGPAEQLTVKGPAVPVYLADALVRTQSFLVEALDAGNNRVGDLDTVQREVTASVLEVAGTNLTTSNAAVAMVNGTVTVPYLELVGPRAQTYTLQFDSVGLRGITSQVRIATGFARSLVWSQINGVDLPLRVAANTPTLHAVCDIDALINVTFQFRLLDGGENLVSISDPSPRSIKVFVSQSVGAQNSTEMFVASTRVTRNTESTMPAQTGLVEFSGLALSQPKVGVHTLTFNHLVGGVAQLRGAEVKVLVTAGRPMRLVLVNGTQQRTQAYQGNGLAKVWLAQPIALEMRDIGGNLAKWDFPRVVTLGVERASVTIVERSASARARSYGAMFRDGASQITAMSSAFAFTQLALTPVAGVYRLNISSFDMVGTWIEYTITHGPPHALGSSTVFPLVHDNKGPLANAPVVFVVDDQLNFVNRSDVLVNMELIPSQQGTIDGNNKQTLFGQANFTGVEFKGTHGQFYAFKFTPSFQEKDLLPLTVPNAMQVKPCVDVRPNTVPSKIGGITCVCQPGWIQDDPLNEQEPCRPCENGEYQEDVGQQRCDKCPLFMDTSKLEGASSESQCECVTGYYRLDKSNTTCLRCPAGATCNQNEFIRPVPGFFRFVDGSDEFFTCPNEAACRGGDNSTCAKGYRGPLCSVCEVGYGSFGNNCLECGDTRATGALVGVIIVLVLLFFVVVIRSASGEKSDASIVLKIMLNYVQVVAFLGEFRVNWSATVQNMYQIFSISLVSLQLYPVECQFPVSYYERFFTYMTFPLFVFVTPAVALYAHYLLTLYVFPHLGWDWRKKMSDESRIDVALAKSQERQRKLDAVFEKLEDEKKGFRPRGESSSGNGRSRGRSRADSMLVSFRRKFERRPSLHIDENKTHEEQVEDQMLTNLQRWYRDLYIVSVLVVSFLAHPSVSRVTLQAFNCAEFSPKDVYLVEDMRIDCQTPEYQLFRDTWATLMLVGYCLGLVMAATYVLVANRHRLHVFAVQRRYRFLYDGYVRKRFFWELVIMMRKLLVVMVIVFARRTPLLQLYGGLWLMMGSLVAHLYGRPFQLSKATNLETLSLMTTVVTLLSGMLFYNEQEMDEVSDLLLSWTLILVNMFTVVVFSVFLTRMLKQAAMKRTATLRMRRMLAKHLDQVAEMEYAKRMQKIEEVQPGYMASKMKRHGTTLGIQSAVVGVSLRRERANWTKTVMERERERLEAEAAKVAAEEEKKRQANLVRRLWWEEVLDSWTTPADALRNVRAWTVVEMFLEDSGVSKEKPAEWGFLRAVMKFKERFGAMQHEVEVRTFEGDDEGEAAAEAKAAEEAAAAAAKEEVDEEAVQEERVEEALRIMEEYLDEDGDNYMENVDYGLITKATLEVDEHHAPVTAFDEILVAVFAEDIEHARESLGREPEVYVDRDEELRAFVEEFDEAEPEVEAIGLMADWTEPAAVLDVLGLTVAVMAFMRSLPEEQFHKRVEFLRDVAQFRSTFDELSEDLREEAANELLEEYLDEDGENQIAVDYGMIMEVTLKLNASQVERTMFDEIALRYFAQEIADAREHYTERPNDLVRGIDAGLELLGADDGTKEDDKHENAVEMSKVGSGVSSEDEEDDDEDEQKQVKQKRVTMAVKEPVLDLSLSSVGRRRRAASVMESTEERASRHEQLTARRARAGTVRHVGELRGKGHVGELRGVGGKKK